MVWASCMAGRLKGRMKNEEDFLKGRKVWLERNVEKSCNLK